MTQSKSPDGSFPDFPFTMPVDGEAVNENNLCVSPTPGLGWIGKLVDAVGWLEARSLQHFIIATDGAGGVSFTRRTPKKDGVTQLFSGVALTGTTAIRCTYTAPLASLSDAVYHVDVILAGDGIPQVVTRTTTYVEIGIYDTSASALRDLAAVAQVFHLSVAPNLAGMT